MACPTVVGLAMAVRRSSPDSAAATGANAGVPAAPTSFTGVPGICYALARAPSAAGWRGAHERGIVVAVARARLGGKTARGGLSG